MATLLSGRVTTRGTHPSDEALLRALFELGRPELSLLPLDDAERHRLMAWQWQAQRQGYAVQWPDATDLVIEVDRHRAGRLLVDWGPPLVTVVDVALLPAVRGQGIGAKVLGGVLAEADRLGRATRLRVATGNPARRLYQRLGFEAIGDDALDTLMEHPARRRGGDRGQLRARRS